MITSTEINAKEYHINKLFKENKKELLSCFDCNSEHDKIRDLSIEFLDCAVFISTLEENYIISFCSEEINPLTEKIAHIFNDFILNKKVFFSICQNRKKGIHLFVSFDYIEDYFNNEIIPSTEKLKLEEI